VPSARPSASWLTTHTHPEAFHRGDYHRLRAGPYRVVYVVEGEMVTIERVDRITDARH